MMKSSPGTMWMVVLLFLLGGTGRCAADHNVASRPTTTTTTSEATTKNEDAFAMAVDASGDVFVANRGLRAEDIHGRQLSSVVSFSFTNLLFRIGICKPDPNCPNVDKTAFSCGCPDCSRPHIPPHIKDYCSSLSDGSSGGGSSSSSSSGGDYGGDSDGGNVYSNGGESNGDSSSRVDGESVQSATRTFNYLPFVIGGGLLAAIGACCYMRNKNNKDDESVSNARNLDDDRSLSGLSTALAGLVGMAGGRKRADTNMSKIVEEDGYSTADDEDMMKGGSDACSVTSNSVAGDAANAIASASSSVVGGLTAAFAGVVATMKASRDDGTEGSAKDGESYVLADDENMSAAGSTYSRGTATPQQQQQDGDYVLANDENVARGGSVTGGSVASNRSGGAAEGSVASRSMVAGGVAAGMAVGGFAAGMAAANVGGGGGGGSVASQSRARSMGSVASGSEGGGSVASHSRRSNASPSAAGSASHGGESLAESIAAEGDIEASVAPSAPGSVHGTGMGGGSVAITVGGSQAGSVANRSAVSSIGALPENVHGDPIESASVTSSLMGSVVSAADKSSGSRRSLTSRVSNLSKRLGSSFRKEKEKGGEEGSQSPMPMPSEISMSTIAESPHGIEIESPTPPAESV